MRESIFLGSFLQPERRELPLITRAASVVIRTRLHWCRRLFQGSFATCPLGCTTMEPSRDLWKLVMEHLPPTDKSLPERRDLCDHSTTSPFS